MLEYKPLTIDSTEVIDRFDDQKLISLYNCLYRFNINNRVVIIGGVALRLLEAILLQNSRRIFSGRDIDLLYLGTDEETRVLVESALNRVDELPPVDVHRLLSPEEGNRAIFRQIVCSQNANNDVEFYLTSLLGKSKNLLSLPLQLLKITSLNWTLYCPSPALLFHMYATRIPGGPKLRDMKKSKYSRLLSLHKALAEASQELLGIRDYSDWTEYRKNTNKIMLSRVIITLVNLNDLLGRPWERLGLATRVR